MFFNVFHFVALLYACACALAMKVHTPKTPGQRRIALEETGSIPISWSSEPGDPLLFGLVVRNLIGGETKRVDGMFESTSDGVVNVPISVGTFQVFAVDPNDQTNVFAASKEFAVTPNGVNESADNGVAAQGGNNSLGSSGDDQLAAGTQPSLNSETASALPSPSSVPSSSGLKPAILGAIIAGAVVLLLIIGLVVFVLVRRHRANADIVRRTTFHRSRMVRSADGMEEKGQAGGPDLEKEFPVSNASIPNPHIGGGGTYGYSSNGQMMEFDEVSIEGSSIYITEPSSYAPSSYAHSTRMEPERYVADLRPQRFKPGQAPVYPFGSPPTRG